MPGNRLTHSYGFNLRLLGESIVEAPQEFSTRLRVIFPCIFTVEDDRHHGIVSMSQYGLRTFFDLLDEVVCGFLRRHAGVNKSDQIRQGVVAENQIHPRVGLLVPINRIKSVRKIRTQTTISVTGEKQAEAATDHSLIRGHPLHAKTVCNRENLLRDTAFGWPYTSWTHSKHTLMEVQAAHKLLPSIFRVAIAILWQWQARGR